MAAGASGGAAGVWGASTSLIGPTGPTGAGFDTWANADCDTGTEILVEWDAPIVNAVWRVTGAISKAANMIAFEGLLALSCVDDGYGGFNSLLIVE